VTKGNIKKGLRKVKWPGRFQIVSKKPLIIVDGAHNVSGVKSLKVTIKEEGIKTPLTVIFGAQKTKNVDAMIKELKPIARKIIVTQSSHPGAMPGKKLAQKIRHIGIRVRTGRDLSLRDIDETTIITGSIFLVADFLSICQ